MDVATSGLAEIRSLLIISLLQFGSHTDTLKYCEYLRHRYRITYLCLDHGLPRQTMDGVEVVYCRRRPFGKVELGLLLAALRLLEGRSFDVVFLRRWKFCFLLRLLCPRVPMVFDIRSGSIESSHVQRAVEDSLTWFNSLFFRRVTVISEGLGKRLKLPRTPHVLPLGADASPVLTQRRPGVLRIAYIGTFKGRQLERTINGLRLFLDEKPGLACRYTIIGFGSGDEVQRIRKAISEHHLADVVDLRERIAHNEVTRVLAEHDVGVGFTPLVPWFEHQPSTKVFEYLAAGLLCVATDTAANREVVDSRNGILIDDTDRGFCDGLRWAANQLPNSNPEVVADTIRDRWWSTIVDSNLAPFLEQVAR